MFNVYNVLVPEDKEKEKYNLENLVRFGENGIRVDPFKVWFGELWLILISYLYLLLLK